jgi:glycosyltransferase involved in cell wall biosynthesis
MYISVVIPTCERKERLLSLLHNLDRCSCRFDEVIIVDSGTDRLLPADYSVFTNLSVKYILSERSVCIQRNTGIRMASSPWIFLCDDDIEILPDYLQVLIDHSKRHPEAGAVSGLWLEKQKNEWKATHPVYSGWGLLWKYVFQLGIWGEINCKSTNIVTKGIKEYYKRKGNHLSKGGWPVNTDFAGDHVICPVYSLGASLVKREWLISSQYDEVLDRHGIGDNYGVAAGFPVPGIHIVTKVSVYHHQEPVNRLKKSLQYYRRILALDYFIRTMPSLKHIKRYRLAWSLMGNLVGFLGAGDTVMVKATFKGMTKILFNRNPYFEASKNKKKITEPVL